MPWPTVLLITLAAVLVLIVAFIVWRIALAHAASRQRDAQVFDRLEPLMTQLEDSGRCDPRLVAELSADPLTRNAAYELLDAHDAADAFPLAHRTPEAIGESSLVFWLLHPNELGDVPEELAYVETQTRDSGTRAGVVNYHVFRYRVIEPSWCAGWQLGVAGAYHRDVDPGVCAPGTFSMLTENPDATNASQQVDRAHERMLAHCAYTQWLAATDHPE